MACAQASGDSKNGISPFRIVRGTDDGQRGRLENRIQLFFDRTGHIISTPVEHDVDLFFKVRSIGSMIVCVNQFHSLFLQHENQKRSGC
jgi:hypothetical protein